MALLVNLRQNNPLALNWFSIYDHHIIINHLCQIIYVILVRKLLHLALCLKRSEATYHQHRFQLKNSCAMCHPRPVASRSRMRSPSPQVASTQVEKYDRQICIISPGRGQNKKWLQSPPSYIFDVLLLSCNTILTYSLQKPIAAHDRNSQTLAKLATINTKGLIHPRILLDCVKAGALGREIYRICASP